jgi:uncharacterized membrane protein YebE (DUF533 family)
MLGLSLGKFLLLAALAGFAWYVFKNWSRGAAKPDSSPRPGPKAPAARSVEAEDMVRCTVCGTYVPAKSARACSRNDCPLER